MATIAAPKPAGRARIIALWSLQILLGLFFVIASGAPKLFGEHTAISTFHQLGWGDWVRYLTGVCEVAGGIGLLVPRLAGPAAAGLAVLTFLAGLTEAFPLHAPAMAVFPWVLTVVFVGIARARRDSFPGFR